MSKPLTDAITALTTYANTVTGASNTDLSSAVATLANGYGQGGGFSADDIATNAEPSGNIVLSNTVTAIGNNAFNSKSNILSVTGNEVLTIGNGAFASNSSATEFNFPKATRLGGNSFDYCPLLLNVYFPNVTTITSAYTFRGSKAGGVAVFPKLTSQNQSFRACGFETIDFRDMPSFGNFIFNDSRSFKTFILRRTNEITTLSHTGGFSGTPFASNGAGGTLYVPQDLISSYQSATNWSTILGYANNQILPIEGSIYETQYADGTPIE